MGFIQYNFPTRINFGAGARTLLPDLLKSEGLSNPLIVTDRGLKNHPVLSAVLKPLTAASIHTEVFSDIWGNPTASQVMAGAKAFKESDADSIIALGGGAAIDVAKAIGLMINHPGNVFDYEDDKIDLALINKPIPYLVALPTTAGTGSEVGRSSVISDDQTKIKKIIFSPRLLPKCALLDPELTLELPPNITASTGMDALSHLVEAYVAKNFHPMCEGIALEGMRLVKSALQQCVEYAHKQDDRSAAHLEARGLMLNASLMGAVAFQKGLGVAHSCAHALSAVCDMHHGLACGIMLPYAMEFNLSTVPKRFAQMSKAAEVDIAWVRRLQEEVEIPATLGKVSVKREHIVQLVEYATQDACHPNNPRPVTQKDFEAIFLQAIG